MNHHILPGCYGPQGHGLLQAGLVTLVTHRGQAGGSSAQADLSLHSLIPACRFQNAPEWGRRDRGGESGSGVSVSVALRDLVTLCCWGKATLTSLFMKTNLDVLEKISKVLQRRKPQGDSTPSRRPASPGRASGDHHTVAPTQDLWPLQTLKGASWW